MNQFGRKWWKFSRKCPGGPLDCAPVSGEGYKAFLDRMIVDARCMEWWQDDDIQNALIFRFTDILLISRLTSWLYVSKCSNMFQYFMVSFDFFDEKWICDVWLAMSQLPSTPPDINSQSTPKDIKGQIEVLQLARSGPGRYNLTHRCTDILGTAERCYKKCDGNIQELSKSHPGGKCSTRNKWSNTIKHQNWKMRGVWSIVDSLLFVFGFLVKSEPSSLSKYRRYQSFEVHQSRARE